CLVFPFKRKFIERHGWAVGFVYLPAAVLFGLRYFILVFDLKNPKMLTVEAQLDKLEIIHFSLASLTSAALLLLTFMQTRASILRQQLKWVVWGLSLSAIPFAIFYAYPYALGHEISQLQAALATGPLILLPISFGYSIVRYRLMDVDIIVRRSMTYALAT